MEFQTNFDMPLLSTVNITIPAAAIQRINTCAERIAMAANLRERTYWTTRQAASIDGLFKDLFVSSDNSQPAFTIVIRAPVSTEILNEIVQTLTPLRDDLEIIVISQRRIDAADQSIEHAPITSLSTVFPQVRLVTWNAETSRSEVADQAAGAALAVALRMARGLTVAVNPKPEVLVRLLAALEAHPEASAATASQVFSQETACTDLSCTAWRNWVHARCGYPICKDSSTALLTLLTLAARETVTLTEAAKDIHQGSLTFTPPFAPAKPRKVSIIIPVFNHAEYTRQCLAALKANTSYSDYEVIVVNNGSSDETRLMLEARKDITAIHNTENKGFTEACNQGAKAATGDYLLFLNNDTIPLKGWLEPLARHLDEAEWAGAAGSRLIYPNGTLQEAAAVVHSDGTASNFGRHDHPALPQFNRPCEVDYCSGACLLVRADLFRELGGFDMRYSPAYYEETDLCFAMREIGKAVVYEPSSVVIHFGSTTAGLDPSKGIRRHLIINREIFLRKWTHRLIAHEPPLNPGQRVVSNDRALLGRRIGPANTSSLQSAPHSKSADSPCSANIPIDVMQDQADARLLAFYLPQFHRVPENDNWWGEGFTDWTNVQRTVPAFPGHDQPLIPGELGWYDLTDINVMRNQTDLARRHGLHGFCFYHYWFHGRRILETPIENYLSSDISLPFCLCWANENWSRNWDGGNRELLLKQRHSPEDDAAHFRLLLRFMQDSRYIRVNGKPLLLVYRTRLLPDPATTVSRWRVMAERAGLPGLYLCKVEGMSAERDAPDGIGFDAAVEFQPDWANLGDPRRDLAFGEHRVYDYDEFVARQLTKPAASYRRYPCVTPRWDNTPRRPKDSVVLLDPSPDRYRRWLSHAVESVTKLPADERLVFINAWNEWGEGCALEPDLLRGDAYLKATAAALDAGVRTLDLQLELRLNDLERIRASNDTYPPSPVSYTQGFVGGTEDTGRWMGREARMDITPPPGGGRLLLSVTAERPMLYGGTTPVVNLSIGDTKLPFPLRDNPHNEGQSTTSDTIKYGSTGQATFDIEPGQPPFRIALTADREFVPVEVGFSQERAARSVRVLARFVNGGQA
jgi:GT2 family glycosyltransferase